MAIDRIALIRAVHLQVKLKPERWFTTTSMGTGDASSSMSSGSGDGDMMAETQWSLLISWMLWLNSGYLGLGALAAGVDNPKRTFPLIVLTIIPFVAVKRPAILHQSAVFVK